MPAGGFPPAIAGELAFATLCEVVIGPACAAFNPVNPIPYTPPAIFFVFLTRAASVIQLELSARTHDH